MTDTDLLARFIIATSIKQIFAMIVALVLVYFGYRLFYLVEKTSGDLIIDSKVGKVRLLKATPGIFLTFFGTLVLVVTLVQHATIDGIGEKGWTSANFGAVATNEAIDFMLCARNLNWARNDIAGSASYAQSAGPVRKNYDEHLEQLTLSLAQCVDGKLGAGSYATYQAGQLTIEEGGRVEDKAQAEIHENVRTMLGE